MISNKFWENKKVFLTGHTGFKGAWLTFCLEKMGANLVGYALRPNTNPSLYELLNLDSKMQSIIGDICNYEKLSQAMEAAKPEIIIHLAAQPLVRYSYNNPLENYHTNVLGTVNVLESFRKSKSAKILINVTTDKCYENKEISRGYNENDTLGGHDPYSNSKACSELVTQCYRDSYFNLSDLGNHKKAVATARAGNVVGGGDWAEDRLIPDLYRALNDGVPLKIRNTNTVRPWQHVLEPLFGYLCLAEKLYEDPKKYSGAWNFGPNNKDCISVKSILELFSLSCSNFTWVEDTASHPHEASILKLDTSKSRLHLGWKPTFPIDFAVRMTAEWYSAYYSGENIEGVMHKQLNDYISQKVCLA